MIDEDQKSEESTRIAFDLWKLGEKHSDHKMYEEYKKILDRMNAHDEEFAVTCLLKIASIIDAYTFQNPPTKNTAPVYICANCGATYPRFPIKNPKPPYEETFTCLKCGSEKVDLQ